MQRTIKQLSFFNESNGMGLFEGEQKVFIV
ncbi:hypothetical protein ABIE66_002493 [Peribacillus sp. B2I2]